MDIEGEQHAEIIRNLSDKDFSATLRSGMTGSPFGLPEKQTWSSELVDAFNDRAIAIANSTGDLSNAIFPADITFEGTEFRRTVFFTGAKFFDVVQFSDVKFFSPVLFRNATFNYAPSFNYVSFADFADFLDVAIFDPLGEGTRFFNVTFHHNLNFRNAKIPGKIVFKKSTFKSSVTFDNCRTMRDEEIFPTAFYFSDVKFARVPWFQNVNIGQDSSIHRANFLQKFSMRSKHEESSILPRLNFSSEMRIMNALKKTSLSEYEEYKNDYWSAEESASRVLRLAMEGIRNRQAEGVFHALELDARRQRPSTPWHQRCLLGIYNHMSQCGQSILRPLAFLCFFFFAFMLWFESAFAMCPSGNDALSSLSEGFRFAFQSIVPFYAQLKGGAGNTLMIPDKTLGCYLSFHIVSLLESLVATGCLAMSIIALRWHLRRG